MPNVPEDVLRALEAADPFVTDNPAGEVTSPLTKAGASAVGAAENAATAVPDFLSRLTSRNLWLRVLKIVAGLVLIITGLVQLTHLEKIIGPAAKAAAGAAVLA